MTIKDIAKATGYSANTVSRALRDKDDIPLCTRDLIKQKALEMGHISNTLASSLRLGYTNTIAVILGDVSNPHFAIMMKEIEEHARGFAYTSFLINTNEDDDLEYQAIQTALNKKVDGIILCPAQRSERNIRFLQATGIPFVLISRRHENIEADYVICDDEMGGYQAGRYLIEHGHRRILMLKGPSYVSSARKRAEGFVRAHRELGVALPPQLQLEVPVTITDWNPIFDKLMLDGVTFSAIFAFSDLVALGVWECLRQRGVRVPEDVSIIGFDHIQSTIIFPIHLTSISSYNGRMSTLAVEALMRCIKDKARAGCQSVVINTKLMEGDTVRFWQEEKR